MRLLQRVQNGGIRGQGELAGCSEGGSPPGGCCHRYTLNNSRWLHKKRTRKPLRQDLTAQPLELQSGTGARQCPLELIHASETRSGGFRIRLFFPSSGFSISKQCNRVSLFSVFPFQNKHFAEPLQDVFENTDSCCRCLHQPSVYQMKVQSVRFVLEACSCCLEASCLHEHQS